MFYVRKCELSECRDAVQASYDAVQACGPSMIGRVAAVWLVVCDGCGEEWTSAKFDRYWPQDVDRQVASESEHVFWPGNVERAEDARASQAGHHAMQYGDVFDSLTAHVCKPTTS